MRAYFTFWKNKTVFQHVGLGLTCLPLWVQVHIHLLNNHSF